MAHSQLNAEELNRLGEEFALRLRRGERVSAAAMADGVPESQRDEVREFLESIALLEELKPGRREDDSRQPALPEHFGRYRIERSLGEGGMGTVYLAHDSQLNRKVALKTPKFSRGSDATMVERFYREARAAATLQHPNICPIYDVGELDGVHYISMAFIDGRPLSDYIRSRKLTPVASVLRIVRRVALAMHEAHRQGLVHRDLKPANIMISPHNEPIVMDFGLARQFAVREEEAVRSGEAVAPDSAHQLFDAALTLEGTVMGSPGYMAPEQLRATPDAVGPGCDIYALGVVLYELLTFQLPFPGDGTLQSVIHAVLTDRPPDASDFRDNLSADIVQICRTALAKTPAERYQTMEEFGAALATALKSARRAPQQAMSEVAATVNSPQLARAREQYDLARSLYQEGQFAAAVSILEKMVNGGADQSGPFRKWAASELPRARERVRQATENALAEQEAAGGFPGAEAVTLDSGQSATRAVLISSRSRRGRRRGGLRHRVIAVVVSLTILATVLLVTRSTWRRPSGNGPLSAARTTQRIPREKDSPPSVPPDSAVADNTLQPPRPDGPARRPAGVPPRRGQNGQRSPLSVAERLWLLDTNRDNRISRDELQVLRGSQAFLFQRILENFDAFDLRPQDGMLNRFETQRMLRLMMRPRDSDNSGTRRKLP